MSAQENPSQAGMVRASLEPTWLSAVRLGGWGLSCGLLVALVVVVLDHRKADSVSQVCVQARVVCLQYQVEKGEWPKDCDLAAPGEQFAGYKPELLAELLARCAVPGAWTFRAKSPTGGPAIVFTPAEPGRSYERVFGVVDGWVDDGEAEKGELLVRPDVALFRLSAE
jgi:hypothetical protein